MVVLANLLGTAASMPFLAGYDLFLQSYRTFRGHPADPVSFAARSSSASAAHAVKYAQVVGCRACSRVHSLDPCIRNPD